MTLDFLSYAATEQPLQAGDPALRARLRRAERSNVIIRDCVLYDDDCSVILPTLHGIDAVVTYSLYGIDIARLSMVGSGSKAIHRDLR
jgi:hypothetical protein